MGEGRDAALTDPGQAGRCLQALVALEHPRLYITTFAMIHVASAAAEARR
jgi:hypothetical protein